MTPRQGSVVRWLDLALLLLAVSPLTAPFSTCDPLDILGGGATVPVQTSIQAKTNADEPAADISSPLGLRPAMRQGAVALPGHVSTAPTLCPRDIPLRL